METVRKCEQCGGEYTRPKGLAFDTFERRRFCSRECNRNAASRPVARYYNTPEEKRCQMCGVIFRRPETVRGKNWASRIYCSVACVHKARSVKAWEQRPERKCAICGDLYRTTIVTQSTCGEKICKQRYKKEIAGPKIAKRARADYASGKRIAARGISPREEFLRPYLEPLGWCWRMCWRDAWGAFEMDFVLMGEMINIELDGPEHNGPKRQAIDAARDAELTARGWRILRISNAEVDADPLAVIAKITAFAS